MSIINKNVFRMVDECPELVINMIVGWLHGRLGTSKAVIGMSGGKDSTITAALCAEAIGKENVYGIRLPDGDQADKGDAVEICNYLGIKSYEFNINASASHIKAELVVDDCPFEDVTNRRKEQAIFNVNPRIRTAYLYAIAQLVGGRVINTSNASEGYIGWCTKWGDNVGDLGVLRCFTCRQVVKLGHALGLPAWMVNKVPADGLTGKSDEENIGFGYDELDDWIEKEIEGPNIDIIRKRHFDAGHKELYIPSFNIKK